MTLDSEKKERQFLEAVEARMNEVLTQRDEVLPQSEELLISVARHLCLMGQAKRVRPLLTYYFGLALNVNPTKLVDAAVASELLHSASLLHDDVIDDASMRRGNISANAKWSNAVAVLAGNYVLSIAFELLRNYSIELTRDGVRIIAQMTKAAVAEIEIRSKIITDLAIWREIAVGKTGALFGMCGLAAARVAGDTDAAARAIRCGNHIGLIFQMTDDILDIVDTSGLKDRYSDIKNKEPSCPLILACEDSDLRQAVKKAWSTEIVPFDDIVALGQLVISSGAVDRTQQIIKKEIETAIDCLGHLAYTDGGKNITYWLKRFSECPANV